MDNAKKMYTLPEAAKVAGVSEDELRCAIKDGLLQAEFLQNTGEYHLPDKELDLYLRRSRNIQHYFHVQNAGPEDTRLRRYLAELWGRIGDLDAAPIVIDAVARLNEMLKQPGGRDGELGEKVTGELIFYLGTLGSLAIDAAEPVLMTCAGDPDAGVRQACASALGDFGRKRKEAGKPPSPAVLDALTRLHGDAEAWVRMNAALGLAKIDSAAGLTTLEVMLDRAWLKERKLQFPDDGHYTVGRDDPAARVILSALIAIDHLVEVGALPHASGPAPTLRSALEVAVRDVHPGIQERAKGLLHKLEG